MNRIHGVGLFCLLLVVGCGSTSDGSSSSEEALKKKYGAFTGAIFTTTKDGSKVDANIYESCADVYLNGGPKGGGPGLPEGDYYFMVTSPSGGPPSVLLSSDALAMRKVHVGASGEFSSYTGSHDQGVDVDDGSVTVQLMPFLPTPNPGGEYKAWLTPVDAYDASKGTFGFVHRWSKTDNFKCRMPGEQPDAGPPPPDSGQEQDSGPPPCAGEDCIY